ENFLGLPHVALLMIILANRPSAAVGIVELTDEGVILEGYPPSVHGNLRQLDDANLALAFEREDCPSLLRLLRGRRFVEHGEVHGAACTIAIAFEELLAGGDGGVTLLFGPIQFAARTTLDVLAHVPGIIVAVAEVALDALRWRKRIGVATLRGT